MKNEIPKEYKYQWVHNTGKHPCFEAAYYAKILLTKGDQIRSADFILPNGEYPRPGEIMRCGNCGKEAFIGIDTTCLKRE